MKQFLIRHKEESKMFPLQIETEPEVCLNTEVMQQIKVIDN